MALLRRMAMTLHSSAPKKSTWLPFAPETCSVVADPSNPPLYCSVPLVAAVTIEASTVTVEDEPKIASFTW